jgi:hypothetical protein
VQSASAVSLSALKVSAAKSDAPGRDAGLSVGGTHAALVDERLVAEASCGSELLPLPLPLVLLPPGALSSVFLTEPASPACAIIQATVSARAASTGRAQTAAPH